MRRFIAFTALAACSSPDVITARQLPAELRADAAAVARGNNQFACDVYAKLGATAGNLFFSPFSISTALAMLDAGAATTTDAELRAALHATLPGDQLHAAYGAILASLEVGRGFGAYDLATADRLFGQQGFAFQPDFLAITKDDYGAELEPVDFANDLDGATATIDQWVADQTDGKIDQLFQPDDLNGAVLALVNAILFKGDWDHQFDPSATRDAEFHAGDGTTITVPMMSKSDAIATTTFPGGGLGVLPFRGRDLSLLVFLPDQQGGLAALEAQLSADAIADALGRVQPGTEDIHVAFPRLELATSRNLVAPLSALGIVSAFDPDAADLSGIDGARDLYVTTIVHQARLHVDEQGAEAVAATGVGVGDASVPPEFVVDRPFVLAIYDNVTASILFMGRVVDPTQP